MKLYKRRNYFLILCALLICAFTAPAGFADDAINLTGANNGTQYDISESGDMSVTGRYTNDTQRENTLIYGGAYEHTLTLDEVYIQEDSAADDSGKALVLHFGDSMSESASSTTLSLSGDNTISAAHMTPIAIESAFSLLNEDNKLIITGSGRLNVTGGSQDDPRRIPAIGSSVAGDSDGYTNISGSITINSGYIVAAGHNAPAIGDFSSAWGTDYGQRITISGGVVEAKTNDSEIPTIGIWYHDNWRKTYITGGSVSADWVANPVNGNDTPLSCVTRDFGVANAGNAYFFEVPDEQSYTYTFNVPDDGIAWLWVPEANFSDIPLVPQTTITADGSEGPIKLTATAASGTPDSYRWFKAESEAGAFTEIEGATGDAYTDSAVTEGNTYWYKTIPVYSSGYFDDVYSNTVAARSGKEAPIDTPEPKLAILAWFGEVRLSLDMGGVTATEYKWFRATSESGPFEEIAKTEVSSYTDQGVKMGTTYWYYAEADGVRSNTLSITPQSGSSSGNCNAGFGVLALFGLLAPAGVILRKRG
ncbi:SYNERG-CTERM sorting domain-containing protein [Synergistaceae bacterium OttesenSCG-928-D05]|nr:SYNERG-CTERM sorting domain-containing protein [Synergistaceae bacterium OttesenSCG-928-D05]